MADGFLARKLHAESTFGSRLDSFADMFFAAACAVKFIPEADLPPWVWAVAVTAALLKTAEPSPAGQRAKTLLLNIPQRIKPLGCLYFCCCRFLNGRIFAVPQARPAVLPLRLRQVNL